MFVFIDILTDTSYLPNTQTLSFVKSHEINNKDKY